MVNYSIYSGSCSCMQKACHIPPGRRWGAYLPSLFQEPVIPLSLWRMVTATLDLRLPSQPRSVTTLWRYQIILLDHWGAHVAHWWIQYTVLIISAALEVMKSIFVVLYVSLNHDRTCRYKTAVYFIFAFFLFQLTAQNEIQILPVLKTNGRHVGILLPVSIAACDVASVYQISSKADHPSVVTPS